MNDISRNPANMASPYVPLDSWMYAAMQRLSARGLAPTAYTGMRPWTRMEFARLLEEAGQLMEERGEAEGDTASLYAALAGEFSEESARLRGAANLGVGLDSVYTRVTGISGTPLRDGYHFGQTIVNDYGRPYWRGGTTIAGLRAHAVAGPLAFYVNGEYQQAPAIPSDPAGVLQATAAADLTLPVSNAVARRGRFRLLEGTVGFQFRDLLFSFGKQSLWLGPGEAGPLLFSNNAEPLPMIKIDHVSPYRIPLLGRFLGPARAQLFLGQLRGHQFEFDPPHLLGPGNIEPQPFLHGFKISFKPTPNLEFGMAMTAQFAGPGLPFTWGNFLRSLYSHTSGANNPGKRLSAFDFSYRVPGLRRWVTVYSDSLVADEYSPIGSSRPTLSPGVYLPQLPKLPKVDFRLEFLRSAHSHQFAPGFVYYGVRRYRSGYTNNGLLLGSWIGRAGMGAQSWLSYWHSPRTRFQLGYRHHSVDKDFIGGGHSNDFTVRSEVMLSPMLVCSTFLQYERWKFAILSPASDSNFTASFQISFFPRWRLSQ